MKHRVVITGMGVVSPNGIGREAFWQATRNGVSGIRTITRFDASGLAAQVAGEIDGFDETRYIAPKDRPHVSRVTPLAIAAVQEALADAAIDPRLLSRDELRGIGVMVGSGGGGQEFTEEQYRLYHSGQWRRCSVYVVPVSTMGTLASEISMRFRLAAPHRQTPLGTPASTFRAAR